MRKKVYLILVIIMICSTFYCLYILKSRPGRYYGFFHELFRVVLNNLTDLVPCSHYLQSVAPFDKYLDRRVRLRLNAFDILHGLLIA